VQTEDTGTASAEIISHVFVGGEILASKRTSYRDLLGPDSDEDVLRKRLERQHKLICAAVYAGRIEDLKRMTEREALLHAQSDTSEPGTNEATVPEATNDRVADVELAAHDEGLVVRLIDEKELRGGQSVTLRLRVTRDGRNEVSGATITMKTLGTSFAPQTTRAVTNERGIAAISLTLPHFEVGRAAILVQCEDQGELAELRRIVLPCKYRSTENLATSSVNPRLRILLTNSRSRHSESQSS
jgi:hypothetical protein